MKKTSFVELDESFSTSENFAELFEDSIQNAKKEGTVVSGTVIAIEKDTVIVDVGLKSEGAVPLKEFSPVGQEATVEVGDQVEVYLERIENRNGKTLLSREKALREESWEVLEVAHNKGENVDGVIFGKVKGGFTVDLSGVVAFLPGSQVDIRPVRDITPLMGIAQPFQILKMDRKQSNIVVSRRAILEESRDEARNELLSQIEEGQVFEGIVKNITDYGAFIDLGSVDGLLHVTDISWSRIAHPSEVLSLGQTVKVQVIKYNTDTKRISLGMKQLESNPWEGVEERYPTGKQFSGKVTNITDYGAFIELEPGIEGLVHVSEISWTKNNVHPRKLLSTSQEVSFIILNVDSSRHRISLGIKQCEPNPWQDFADKNPVGTILEGEVKNIVDFGLFVGFGGEIDGLVHVSDISWDDSSADVLKAFKPADPVKVTVLSIDVEKERISLGIKQLESDPFESSLQDIKKGVSLTCTVTAVENEGIEVDVNEHVKGFIKKSDLSTDRAEQRPARFAIGERVDAKVISVDKSNRKVSLSIKALELDEHKKAIAEYGSADSGANLGDILGAALNKAESENNNG